MGRENFLKTERKFYIFRGWMDTCGSARYSPIGLSLFFLLISYDLIMNKQYSFEKYCPSVGWGFVYFLAFSTKKMKILIAMRQWKTSLQNKIILAVIITHENTCFVLYRKSIFEKKCFSIHPYVYTSWIGVSLIFKNFWLLNSNTLYFK